MTFYRRSSAAALIAALAVAPLALTAAVGIARADDASVTKELTPIYDKFNTLYAAGDLEGLQNYVQPDITWKGADGKVRPTEELVAQFQKQRATQKNVKTTGKIEKLLSAGDTAVVEITQHYTADQTQDGKTVPYVEDATLRSLWVKSSDGAWRIKYLETLKSTATLDGKPVAGLSGSAPQTASTGTAPAAGGGKTVTLASGLQYEDLKVGDGKEAKPTDTVVVHYTGTLTDGTKFDSSRDRGEPATFPLDRVIPGFKEGISGMKVGGRRKLTIPSKLGYGASGAGGVIPPNATLIFDVELIDVK